MREVLDQGFSEKIPQIFSPSLLAEYVTAFSERTDAPEYDLTDTHTDPTTVTLAAHVRRGLLNPSLIAQPT